MPTEVQEEAAMGNAHAARRTQGEAVRYSQLRASTFLRESHEVAEGNQPVT